MSSKFTPVGPPSSRPLPRVAPPTSRTPMPPPAYTPRLSPPTYTPPPVYTPRPPPAHIPIPAHHNPRPPSYKSPSYKPSQPSYPHKEPQPRKPHITSNIPHYTPPRPPSSPKRNPSPYKTDKKFPYPSSSPPSQTNFPSSLSSPSRDQGREGSELFKIDKGVALGIASVALAVVTLCIAGYLIYKHWMRRRAPIFIESSLDEINSVHGESWNTESEDTESNSWQRAPEMSWHPIGEEPLYNDNPPSYEEVIRNL